MTRRRGGSLAFVAALALATGAAFAAGSHLRTRFPRYAFDHPTQIAQAGGGGGGGGAQASGANGVLRIGDDPTSAGGAADDDVGLGPLQTFQTVYSLVKKNYVDPLPDDRKLSHGAVRAMLASLNDPNCQFFEPAERAALDGEARGRYAGIGAALAVVPHKRDGYTEHKITVVTPLPGSPAEKVGLRTGDVILSVDGKWVLGSDPFLAANKLVKKFQARDAEEEDVTKAFEAATARLKGGIGLGAAQKKLTAGQNETRTLTLQRAGVKDPVRVAITTAVTEVAPVEARKLAGGDVGYIKISAFTEGSGARFREALGGLPKPQQGLVLDLRGNPGGLLAPAREIAGLLTKGGKIGVEVGPNGKRTAVTVPLATHRALRPVIVLVDGGTASTAEALAAALRDKQVATLVGGKTFGDALAQTLYLLPDGSAYTLVTGKLLGPNGTDWQRVGLTPGVAVPKGASEQQVIARAVSVLRDRTAVVASAAATAAPATSGAPQ